MNEKPGVINVNALRSAEPEVRQREWSRVHEQWRPKLGNFFLGQTRNDEDAQDLVQELFLKMHQTLGKKPLRADRDPEAYVWTVAHNLCNDRWRIKEKQRKYVDSDSEKHLQAQGRHFSESHVEEEVLGRLGWQEIIALCLRLQRDQDRVLALLRHVLSYKPYQIHCAMGRPLLEIRNQVRRVDRELRRRGEKIDEYLGTPSEWEEQLGFADGQYALSVAILNVFPRNVAPESRKELFKDLGVNSVEQLRERFVCGLFIGAMNTLTPASRIYFIPRADLETGVMRGERPATYLEYLLRFNRVSVAGGWEEYLFLVKDAEYPAWMRRTYYDSQDRISGWEWHQPTRHMVLQKKYSEKVLLYGTAHWTLEQAILPCRFFPS